MQPLNTEKKMNQKPYNGGIINHETSSKCSFPYRSSTWLISKVLRKKKLTKTNLYERILL